MVTIKAQLVIDFGFIKQQLNLCRKQSSSLYFTVVLREWGRRACIAYFNYSLNLS